MSSPQALLATLTDKAAVARPEAMTKRMKGPVRKETLVVAASGPMVGANYRGLVTDRSMGMAK